MAVIGLDLGGTKLASAVFQPDGTMINKEILPLEKRTGEEVFQLILKAVSQQTGFARSAGIAVKAIGCCIPGIVYQDSGKVWAPNIQGWDDFPLLDKIREKMQDVHMDILLDNDRACSIMGEVWQGAGRGCKNVIFLAVGTGIGAGIMADGKILRGASDIAGAVGWLALDPHFREKYKMYGCFEYNASGDGISRIALEYLQDEKDTEGILAALKPDEITTREVFHAYRQGDPIAVKVMKHAVVYWGMTVANLVSLFNPEKIIFGGGVFGPAVILLEDIFSEARKWAQPVSIQQVKLEPSMLGSDAGLTGSAFMALFNRPGTDPNN